MPADTPPTNAASHPLPPAGQRQAPVGAIAAWFVYSLLALGYFGYQSALLGSLCIGPR